MDDPAVTDVVDVVAPVDAAGLIAQVRDHAIIALDSSGTIESWNLGAQRLTGWNADEIVGHSLSVFYPDDERRAGLPLELLDRARRDGSVEHTGWRVRKDGSQLWCDVTITALHDEAGRVTGFAAVTRDLTDQHDLELSLRRSEERFRLLVGQVRDYAIFALDGSGTIESWNAGAERLKGWTTEEALGRSSSIFYTPEDRRAGLPLALLSEARREGRVEHTGWRVRKDGTRFWADVVLTALESDDGTITGFAKITRDLTEARRVEEAQRTFYSTFAHDFLTPVTALQGYADLLRDATPEEREGFVVHIEQNAARLGAMMGNLVAHAPRPASSAPQLPVAERAEAIDVVELVHAVRGRLGTAYAVDRVVVEPAGLLVRADPAAMERILTNIVSNALLYAEHGDVAVRLVEHAGLARLTVADTGRGIHPDDIGTIFEEYQRGRLADEDGGSGLGLASARHLVEQQGGTIAITSRLGGGTTVTMDFPSAGAARTATVSSLDERRSATA